MPLTNHKINFFLNYLKEPTRSAVLNSKLLLLTAGLDFDFNRLKKEYPNLKDHYKVNKIRVSDRHFIGTQSESRNYIPDELIISEDNEKSVCKVFYKPEAPFIFTYQNGRFTIIDKKTKQALPVDIQPVALAKYTYLKYKSIPLDEFITIVGVDRLSVIPFDGCDNWPQGLPCLFCGANPSRLGFGGIKPNVYQIQNSFCGNYKKWWDDQKKEVLLGIDYALAKFKQFDRLQPHAHFNLIGGNLLDMDFCWQIALEITQVVKKHIDLANIDSHFNLMAPHDLKLIDQAKKLGFINMDMNLECFDYEHFKLVCPGKEKEIGYQKIRQALEYSVKIFGKGYVRSNFVLGAEPANLLLKGAEELAGQGIVADYTIFFPRPGSQWADKPIPKADEVLSFTQELVKVHKQHNFHPFSCRLSSRSSIANEVYDLNL